MDDEIALLYQSFRSKDAGSPCTKKRPEGPGFGKSANLTGVAAPSSTVNLPVLKTYIRFDIARTNTVDAEVWVLLGQNPCVGIHGYF